MATCNGCGAQIDWVITKAGKKMPVNLEYSGVYPKEPGTEQELLNTIVTDQGEVKQGPWAPDRAGIARGRTPHFATCPDARKFRKQEVRA